MKLFDVYISNLGAKFGDNFYEGRGITFKSEKDLIKFYEKKFKIKLTLDRPAKCRGTQDHHRVRIYEKLCLSKINECLLKELECDECKKKFTLFQEKRFDEVSGILKYSGVDSFLNSFTMGHYCQRCLRQKEYNSYNSEDPVDYGVTVIYKITNKKENKSYIGKTYQSFTLRWWQHLKENKSTKFGEALTNTEITDWTFEVVKVLTKDEKICEFEIEDEYIRQYDTIENGYNSRYNSEQKEK